MKINGEMHCRTLFLFLLIAGLISSCVPPREIKYLQKKQAQDTTSYYKNQRMTDRKIQPRDYLYIRVYTMDEKANNYFNRGIQPGASATSNYYLDSYFVTNEGMIDFQLIGKVYVKDMTAVEIQQVIQKKIDEYLKETLVVVKIVNFNITLVGEVSSPGMYSIYKDDISIFEALSLAGDMTDFSNRKRVALIRKTSEGSRVIYLNLTSDKLLSSSYYYLQPNDIIYVMPLGYKTWGLGSTIPWAFAFGLLSTTLLLINYFK